MSTDVLDILKQLPRWDDCTAMIVNPRTKKPFTSFYGSWDTARRKANLPHLSIHELRNSIRRAW